MKTQVKLFKKLGTLTSENNFKTIYFDSINEALEIAEYFYHNYFYQVQIIDNEGEIYAEYEN
jgi:hypothetical protein